MIARRLETAIQEMKSCYFYDYCIESSSKLLDLKKLINIYYAEKMRVRNL